MTDGRSVPVHARFEGSTPPLLALHGFSGSGQDFAALAEASGRGLIAPHLAGHGSSPLLGPCSMASEVARLSALLTLWSAPPVLLGYSLGGRTALSWACADAASFAALILIGASPGLDAAEEREARLASDQILAERITSAGVLAFADFWEGTPIISSQANIPEPYGSALRTRRRHCSPEGLSASLKGMGTGRMPSLWSAIAELPIPTLLLTGAEDSKFCRIAEAMRERIPSAVHRTVDGAGHCCHLEQPERTAALIDNFLARL